MTRAAGSHGPADLVVDWPIMGCGGKIGLYIQCKHSKDEPKISPEDRKVLKALCVKYGRRGIVALGRFGVIEWKEEEV